MSTTLRLYTLRLLRLLKVKQFLSKSSLGQPFICHVGDSLGEQPYYNREAHLVEIALMSSWCSQFEESLIIDVGGHVGFVATQLALSLRPKRSMIYTFEPVPHTFRRLMDSIDLLNLKDAVFPVCSAISEQSNLAYICYSEWDSMLAQMVVGKPNERIGNKVALVNMVTIDQVVAALGSTPSLMKIDVEGHEMSVLKGARNVLAQNDKPGVCFELNPVTLHEAGTSVKELVELLRGYDFFYVNDFQGQRIELGVGITDFEGIDWVCNIFAVPSNESAQARWFNALVKTKEQLLHLQ